MKSARVSFIIPPSSFLLDERVFMSLGVLKVAAVVERAHPVDVLDLAGIQNYDAAFAEYLGSTDAAFFGITVTTPQLPAAVQLIRMIRRLRPAGRIILGGPHVTLVHTAYLRERKHGAEGRSSDSFHELEGLADVLVAGDGERAIFEALGPAPPKIINADDHRSPLFLHNADLNVLPWPARHLVDVASYHYSIDGEAALSIVSQLGCPFGCGFCGGRHSPSLRGVRSRTPASVVAEMEHLYRTYGVKGFMFYDDELNVNRTLFVDLMKTVISLQERLGVEFKLRGFVKAQLFNDEQADVMYRAGFRWVLSGFESSSPEILLNMNKRSTVEDNSRCVQIAHRHGLKVKALMSLGHPNESEKTALMSKEWLIRERPDDFDISIITVYPGTPYFDEAVHHEKDIWVYTRNGAKLYSQHIDYTAVANYYKGDPDGGYQAFVFTDFLRPEEIVVLRNEIERDIRRKLNIPFPSAGAAARYEHSMGQGPLPPFIMRSSDPTCSRTVENKEVML